VGEHKASGSGSGLLRGVAAVVLVLLVGGLLLNDALGPEPTEQAQDAPSAGPSDPVEPSETAAPEPQQVVSGDVLLPEPSPTRKPTPKPPVLAPASTGRVGTGLRLGALTDVEAPVGPAVTGTVTTAVANLPNRTGDGPFAGSIRTLVSAAPDFVMLNEVSRHDTAELRGLAPGYGAYRDEDRDATLGGDAQSMMNVVMWREADWTLVDAGRVKLVDDDRGFRQGKPFIWDRYATWTVLQRADGAVVSVVSTHMMTNPARYPGQHGNPRMSRAQQYGVGMEVLLDTVRLLATRGPVLVGGDMNTHGREGSWAAAPRMSAAGYGHAKDNAVMYVFYPDGVEVVAHRQVPVASDHPAIVTTLDLQGVGPRL
jgi:endonuclease/exonuclease/phosphatase family metal-dependent hydrolase